MKPYLGDNTTNWIDEFSAKSAAVPASSTKTPTAVSPKPILANQALAEEVKGAYDDPWLGRFIIEQQSSNTDAALQIRSLRVEKLLGLLYPHADKDSLLVQWLDRSLEADVVAKFARNEHGEVRGMQLIPASKDIDFSYDFQDLDFTKIN
jgi:hypothetical protein